MTNEHKSSGIQKFFKAIFPASWSASMEAESRQWKIQCPNCNFERSVWETGGVRWKASGYQEELITNPPPRSGRAYKIRRSNQKKFMNCPNCGQGGWHSFYKKEEQ